MSIPPGHQTKNMKYKSSCRSSSCFCVPNLSVLYMRTKPRSHPYQPIFHFIVQSLLLFILHSFISSGPYYDPKPHMQRCSFSCPTLLKPLYTPILYTPNYAPYPMLPQEGRMRLQLQFPLQHPQSGPPIR